MSLCGPGEPCRPPAHSYYKSIRAVSRREGPRHQQRQGPPSIFSCQDIPFPFYTSGGWDPKEQEQSCKTLELAEGP